MFSQIIKKSVDNTEGGIAAIIMGLDGIAVETYVRVQDRIDINTVAMEFSFILTQVKKAADALAVGACEELTVKADGLTLVIRMLTPQYFVAMALGTDGNFGKARFMLRMAAPNLIAQL